MVRKKPCRYDNHELIYCSRKCKLTSSIVTNLLRCKLEKNEGRPSGLSLNRKSRKFWKAYFATCATD